MLPNAFYKANAILIVKPGKANTEKETAGRCRDVMNIDAKILNKIRAREIQQHVGRKNHHNRVGLVPDVQGARRRQTGRRDAPRRQNGQKRHMTRATQAAALDKCNLHLRLKHCNVGMEGRYFNVIKATGDNPQLSPRASVENKASPLRSEWQPSSCYSTEYPLEVLPQQSDKKKI